MTGISLVNFECLASLVRRSFNTAVIAGNRPALVLTKSELPQ